MPLAHNHAAHLLVGTIQSSHCRRLHSLMRSVGQAVYEKSPHLAVATPELVSAHREKSEDNRQLSITVVLRRSESTFLTLVLHMRFLHFPGPSMLLEKRLVLRCTISTSRRGRADRGYTYVTSSEKPSRLGKFWCIL